MVRKRASVVDQIDAVEVISVQNRRLLLAPIPVSVEEIDSFVHHIGKLAHPVSILVAQRLPLLLLLCISHHRVDCSECGGQIVELVFQAEEELGSVLEDWEDRFG
ncbi:hypothetical protein LINPERPRIM_LOCUS39981 [Linum perenne]